MSAAPLVSVVIPVFNGERYLPQAIDSVLAQADVSVEVIVVDDGSTDGSAELTRSYGAPVRYLRQANAGVGSARNAGVAAATGELLAFVDQDDVWLPDKLSQQIDLLQKNPELDCVFGLVDHFRDGPDAAAFETRAGQGVEGFLPGTLLIRREAFLRSGGFPTDRRLGEFIDWFARACEAGLHYQVVPNVVLRRRIHADNATARLAAQRADYAQVLLAALDRRRWAAKWAQNGDTSQASLGEGWVNAVIPVRNGETWLKPTIDCLLAQDYPQLEVLVIDAASNDATRRLAESYGPPVVCIHRSDPSLEAARRIGFEHCHGEFVALMEPGVLIPPGTIQRQMAALKQAQEPSLVVSQATQVFTPAKFEGQVSATSLQDAIRNGEAQPWPFLMSNTVEVWNNLPSETTGPAFQQWLAKSEATGLRIRQL